MVTAYGKKENVGQRRQMVRSRELAKPIGKPMGTVPEPMVRTGKRSTAAVPMVSIDKHHKTKKKAKISRKNEQEDAELGYPPLPSGR